MRFLVSLALALTVLSSLPSCKGVYDEDKCRENCERAVGTTDSRSYRGRANSVQQGHTMERCMGICMEDGYIAVAGFMTNKPTRPMCEKACRHHNQLKKNAGEQADEVGMVFGTSAGGHRQCVQSCLGARKEAIQCIMNATTPRQSQLCVK